MSPIFRKGPLADSLIDTIRAADKTILRCKSIGVDPDLSTTAIAVVSYFKGDTTPTKISSVHTFVAKAEAGTRSMTKVMSMVDAVTMLISRLPMCSSNHLSAIVESQQLYPDRNESPRSVVAKGNDLIGLATVSGAAAGALLRLDSMADVQLRLPATWKGQMDKKAMHARLKHILGDVEVDGPNNSHTRDAICMAIKNIGMWS